MPLQRPNADIAIHCHRAKHFRDGPTLTLHSRALELCTKLDHCLYRSRGSERRACLALFLLSLRSNIAEPFKRTVFRYVCNASRLDCLALIHVVARLDGWALAARRFAIEEARLVPRLSVA